jgi:quercetin dioxygenase-like cupin family protein
LTATNSRPSTDGWDINRGADAEWVPWGSTGDARAKVLGSADGYQVVLVEADAGYRGSPHLHEHAEFFYLLAGRIRNQGRELDKGDGYAAAAGSTHDDFEVLDPATYLTIFRI